MLRLFSAFLLTALTLAAAPCDLILSARYVITMDARRQVIENGAIAIRESRIVAVGTKATIATDAVYHSTCGNVAT